MPPIELLVFTPLIVLGAYVVFGISGFGSTLMAVPLLAHLYPLKFVIPMVVVLDCVGAIGMGTRLRADVFKEAYDRGGAVRELLNRYIHTVVVVGSHATACNALHKVKQRMCKWLLMSSDGVGSDEVNLTHEYLATMLAVRRASVTETALELQEAGLIRYNRGHVLILDRAALEACACECYRRTKAEYERLFAA